MGPGDKWEDGMWQIINNHLSHCFPCSAVWQSAPHRQGAASSASQDAAAAVTTHMWPQCSGAAFLRSRISCWYTNEIGKNKKMHCDCANAAWVVFCNKERPHLQRKADEKAWHEVWSNEKVNEIQKLVCIVMWGIFLKINNHLTC